MSKRKNSNSKKGSSNKKGLLNALIIVFSLILIVSATMFIQKLLEYKKGTDMYKAIEKTSVTLPEEDDGYLNINHSALVEANSDYMAWVYIPETKISYPVVYAADYEEYIHTGFDGKYLYAGSIFTDYNCKADMTSRNTIFYGHNMNDGSMFAALRNYLEEGYLREHELIHVYVEGKVLIYQVFSVYRAVAADESYTVSFDDNAAFLSWAREVQNKSWYTTNVDLNEDDNVIMLSTCRGGENNDRNVVFAVLIDEIDLD